MFITPHSDVRNRQPMPGATFDRMQQRLAWARQHLECAVELRGVAVATPEYEEYRWSYVRAYVGPESELQRLPALSYAHCSFRSEIVTFDEFLARADECQLITVGRSRNGQQREPLPFRIGDLRLPAQLEQGWTQADLTSGSHHCHWPCWAAFSALTCGNLRGPLVSSKPNHPLFSDYDDLLKHVGGLTWFRGPGERRQSFNLIIADQRGQITNLAHLDNKFCVSLSGTSLADLTLQVRSPDHSYNESICSPGEVVEIEAPPTPCTVQLALVADVDEFLDWGMFSVFPTRLPSELRQLVASGENELVEFKPWTVAGEVKFAEIVNTVIAMANGRAPGFLIIGIDDMGRPQWSKGMKKYLKDALDASSDPSSDRGSQQARHRAAAESYAQQLRDDIQQRVAPCPQIDIEVTDFADGVVLQLKIFPHKHSLVRNVDTNEIHVRRGASNRFPTPEELRVLQARG